MKILYCYPYGILGGVCTQLWNRARHLSKTHEIHCLFERDYGVADYLGPYATLHFGSNQEQAEELVRAQRFDVVVVIDAPIYLDWFARPSESRPYRVALEIHTTYQHSLKYLENTGVHIDCAVVPSNYMREMLTSRDYPILRGKRIRVASNSIDPGHFAPVDAPSTHVPVILWVGKMDDHKNWRGAMRIAGEISTPCQLWFVGGETCPDEVAHEVIDYAHERGLADRFRWLDRVEYAAMPRLYSTVARGGGCNLVTSTDESFGMSVVEGLLSGLPVVSTDVGAIPEIVQGNGHAYARLFARDQESDAVQELTTLLGSDAHQTLLAARAELAARFAPDQVNAKYEQFLREVVGAALPATAPGG